MKDLQPRTGRELALSALDKEYKVLCKRAAKAKSDADRAMTVGSDLHAIDMEFYQLLSAGLASAVLAKKLEELSKRKAPLEKLAKKDLVGLFDRQFLAECERDNLSQEISNLKFYAAMRSPWKQKTEEKEG